MNYLDLFSGIGGFHLGLSQAGFKFDWCGHSEIDKYAKQTYEKHFPDSEDLGDVRTIRYDRIPGRISLITFGFPCQDLSIAGKRAGLAGQRSGLFSEAIRLVQDTKPDYFIFENVKGLFSSSQGRDFEYVLRTIADIGYDGQWQLLNTRWVLPQNRERIYFVGHIRGQCRPEVFPIGEGDRVFTETRTRKQGKREGISSTIDSRYGSLRNAGETYLKFVGGIMGEKNKMWLKDGKENSRNFPQGQRVYDSGGISCQLTAQGGGWGAKTGLYLIDPFNKSFPNDQDNTTSLRTNFHNGNIWLGQKNQIRRLTPLECSRLQGFNTIDKPDEPEWCEGISDTQKYKCLGNAITVPIVKLIGEKLLSEIQKELIL